MLVKIFLCLPRSMSIKSKLLEAKPKSFGNKKSRPDAQK